LADNIILLPVDKNRNGRIDTFEKIFDSPADLSRGIWIGKYPHSLSVTIYAAARVKPSAAGELAFLSWVLTGGGAVLTAHGYSDLAGIEKQSGLAALDINKISVRPVDSRTASFTWLIILLCSGVAGVIVIFAFGMTGKEKRASSVIRSTRTPGPLNAATITTAGGVYYDKTHTWAHMEKDGLVRIGIDDFLQHVTGDISKVLLKEPGTAVRRGEPVLTIIREGKQLRIYAPVSGIIRAQNTNLFIDSSIINASPYSDGWIYLIEPGNWLREIQLMFMTASYKKWLEEEFSRLKIFFTGTLKQEPAFAKLPVLQDGGELTDNILADLGPEVWEEFQISFIDSSR
jgi:glycine cleavage system H lipoate-binding protein